MNPKPYTLPELELEERTWRRGFWQGVGCGILFALMLFMSHPAHATRLELLTLTDAERLELARAAIATHASYGPRALAACDPFAVVAIGEADGAGFYTVRCRKAGADNLVLALDGPAVRILPCSVLHSIGILRDPVCLQPIE